MPSEQRLHPASLLFSIAKSAKAFALPGLLLLITAGRTSGGRGGNFGRLPENWELWLMLLLIPSAVVAVVHYLSYRIRYEGTELVIRSGIVFRSERHVPYARIQNLDGVQNLFHRLLGVVEVRVETGGGNEPEARISVLPEAAFDEMRRHVFELRRQAIESTDPGVAAPAPAPAAARTLLHLRVRELLLFGFLENRGFVVIGAAYGLAWELGLLERLFGPIFTDGSYIRQVVRTGAVGALAGGIGGAAGAFVVFVAGVALLLVVVRVISMVWGAVRLYDFRLTRTGEDLHTRFGLLTRVAATIPIRRVQTLTISDGPLYRLASRVSVQVETAGSNDPGSGGRKAEREWLAPLLRRPELRALTGEVMPELDLDGLDWQRPHPRAFRRAATARTVLAVVISLMLAPIAGFAAAAVLPVAIAWALVAARKYVKHLAWAMTSDVVAFRSGWLWRRTTVARVAKIQVVTQFESPFDRRTAMARVRVDTAGGSERSHRVDIPYLGRDTADRLHRTLARQAARTTFK